MCSLVILVASPFALLDNDDAEIHSFVDRACDLIFADFFGEGHRSVGLRYFSHITVVNGSCGIMASF